jgi:hypothetical protein
VNLHARLVTDLSFHHVDGVVRIHLQFCGLAIIHVIDNVLFDPDGGGRLDQKVKFLLVVLLQRLGVVSGCQKKPKSRPIRSKRDLLIPAYLLKVRVDTCQKRPIKEQKGPTDTGMPALARVLRGRRAQYRG